MDTNAIVSWTSLAIGIFSTLLGVINHKRIRSQCCGRSGEISFDIENTTPPSAASASANQSVKIHPLPLP